jgi:hypothetical protein
MSMIVDGRLPDEALVVRCGQPPFDPVKVIRDGCREHPDGFYGFSVQCAAGAAIEMLAAWCSNNKIGWATVGAVRAAGYDIVTTSGDGYHATVVVPRDWETDAATLLLALFAELTNPIPKGSRLR